VLLGTTFPLMAAGLVRRSPDTPGRSVADVYLLNTLGGAAGIVLAGFALIPVLGLAGAAVAAAVLNFAAALLARGGDLGVGATPVETAPAEVGAADPSALPAARAAIAEGGTPKVLVPLLLGATLVSALASFLYEIGWVRMLALLLGSASHAFELMLSAFLLGLGFGSLLVRRRADESERPVRLTGAVQWLMGLAALLTLPIYVACFPVMAWLVTNLPPTDRGYLLFNAARYGIALVVMLPATLLAGMTLPLIAATLLRRGAGERAIGLANGANTMGSVLGAVAGGLFVLPGLGLEGILTLGAGLDMAVGVALLAAAAPMGRRLATAGGAGVLAALLVVGVTAVVGLDRALLTSGVYRTGSLTGRDRPDLVSYQDGATATVSVHRTRSGLTSVETNGKPDGSLPPRWRERAAGAPFARGPIGGGDEATQIYAPLLTIAHRPDARRVAVVGHGTGMSAQLLLGSARIERLVTIEIEPAMILASQAFLPANRKPFADPRSSFLIEDARTALAGAGEGFDLIFSEPSNPWVSGVASLFTHQFYARVRERLTPGGVFGQWFHLYEMEDDLLLSVLAAIDRSFPDWTAWIIGRDDMLIVAARDTLTMPDWSVLREPGIVEELSLAPLPSPGQLAALWVFDDDAMAPLVARSSANSDYRPILDARAERARFRRSYADGFFAFADHPLDVPRMLARRPMPPPTYDSIPVSDVPPMIRHALATWLTTGDARRTPPPHPGLFDEMVRETAFQNDIVLGLAPTDWAAWVRRFVAIEGAHHGRAAGWVDEPFYRAIERFMDARGAPDEARATLALLEGVRTFDFPRAADAADRLGMARGATLMPPALLLDAAVAAYVGAGRVDAARAAYETLAPATGGRPGNAYDLWMAALVGAEPRRAEEPRD
jgi:spermidine synthase